MSGIAGIYGDERPDIVASMLEQLEHRGPKGARVYGMGRATVGCNRIKGRKTLPSERSALALADGRYFAQEDMDHAGESAETGSGPEDATSEGLRSDGELMELFQQEGAQALQSLNGPFALAVAGDGNFLVARDPLGLKPLYYGRDGNNLLFASEIKGLVPFTSDIHTFPPGHYFDPRQGFVRYFAGLDTDQTDISVQQAAREVRQLLVDAVARRTAEAGTLGIYLSGGIDSSVIAAAAAEVHPNRDIKTFAVGTKESSDLPKARMVAEHLGTDHYEYIYETDEMLAAVPDVIYYLESFDQYLVRSSIVNYLIGGLARSHGVDLVLCGEGGDELYGGYHYLKDLPADKVRDELIKLTVTGHSGGFQRVDRMNMAHSLIYDLPFMDRAVWEHAVQLPVAWKLYGPEQTEKWILRKAFEDALPEEIVWRRKAKFFEGAGAEELVAQAVEARISDEEFARERDVPEGLSLRSKEELYYYRIFRQHYPHRSILDTVGRTFTVN